MSVSFVTKETLIASLLAHFFVGVGFHVANGEIGVNVSERHTGIVALDLCGEPVQLLHAEKRPARQEGSAFS